MPAMASAGSGQRKPVRRRARSRLQAWFRVLVTLFAVVGLMPVAEATDAVATVMEVHADVHASEDGCGEDCDDGCDRAGCHGCLHHCGCCAPVPRLTTSTHPVPASLADEPQRWNAIRERVPPEDGEAPPRRPPKA